MNFLMYIGIAVIVIFWSGVGLDINDRTPPKDRTAMASMTNVAMIVSVFLWVLAWRYFWP